MPTPEQPTGRIVVDPPPTLEPDEGVGAILTSAVPMLGSLGSVALVATMASQQDNGHRSLVAAGMFVLGTLGFVVVQVDRQRQRRAARLGSVRTGYRRHLAEVRDRARAAAEQQRRALVWHHPSPAALPAVATDRHRASRRGPADAQYLLVRVGEGPQPPSVELVPPPPDADEPDPVAAAAVDRLLSAHRLVPALPMALDLRRERRVELRGPSGQARSTARAMLCSAAVAHGPADLVVAVLAAPPRLHHWEWLKWLPHAASPVQHDAAGPRRLVAPSAAELCRVLPEPARGHLLVVLDGVPATEGDALVRHWPATTAVELGQGSAAARPTAALRLDLGPGPERPSLLVTRRHAEAREGTADQCDPATAEAVARRLLPSASAPAGDDDPVPEALGLWGLPDVVALDPAACWRADDARRLRIAIGTTSDGAPLHLDLEEAARGGAGPHGLVVGATGSGKSELLRTLVLGLALRHPPDDLNLVLVDFKGGATFAGVARLPHVAALVTNLSADLTLVDRMQDALTGELVRRQQLLRAAGDLASVHDHALARRSGADLPPLPSLLVVVDEFSELLAARPEFVELFTAMGRLGRSLGVHLLLASQRLDEGRLRGLESHLSYRVALRTFGATESRAVLGVPDAAELPMSPGVGFLRAGPDAPVRFRAAYVSGSTRSPRPPRAAPARVLPFTLAEVEAPDDAPPEPDAGGGRPLLDLVVDRLAGHGPPARQLWLPPLTTPDSLDQLLGDLAVEPGLGLLAPRWRPAPLRVPVGSVDLPHEQRRDPLVVDLTGSGGHVAVVGAPRSGRSTLLSSLVSALALTATPHEAQFFVVDLAGGALAPLAGLPHTSGFAGRTEPDVLRRIVAELGDLLDRREARTSDHSSDPTERQVGRDDGYGEVFLVVDGWSALRDGDGELEAAVHRLVARGLAHGVHLLTATSRWADFRASTRDLLGHRLELRLGDPLDSEVDRRAARLVPHDRPGRGLTREGRHFLAALPRIDGDPDPATTRAGLTELVARVAAAWPGKPAPRLQPLPARIALDELAVSAERPHDHLLLGLDETLGPVTFDPRAEAHLLVLGDHGAGRTATLRTIVRQVVRTHEPDRAQVVVVDPRRSLLGEVPPSHLLGHHRATAGPPLRELADHLRRRLPGPDVTAAQLRARSWWSGADVWVVVDDHDLLTAGGTRSPVAELLELLPHAGDVGLHLVLGGSAGRGSRPLAETWSQTLRDLGCPVLLLPGRPEDGPLTGRMVSRPGPPGRARLVERARSRILQVAWTEPRG